MRGAEHACRVCVLLLILASGCLADPSSSELWAVSVIVDGKTVVLQRAEIAGMPHITVRPSYRDREAEFEGVRISTLLSRAGVDVGFPLRGTDLSQILVVEAADGERVTFSLSELDDSYSDNQIILADHQDGKELSVRDWPRIVAGKDKRMDRWLVQVVKLSIVTPK
jgi:hypothetical protein